MKCKTENCNEIIPEELRSSARFYCPTCSSNRIAVNNKRLREKVKAKHDAMLEVAKSKIPDTITLEDYKSDEYIPITMVVGSRQKDQFAQMLHRIGFKTTLQEVIMLRSDNEKHKYKVRCTKLEDVEKAIHMRHSQYKATANLQRKQTRDKLIKTRKQIITWLKDNK